MRTLILAAGRFGDEMREKIQGGREPRLDVFEIATALGADVIDYLEADRAASWVSRTAGASAGVAYLGFQARNRYDAILTTGEDIGLPLSAMLKASSARCSHTMIAHTLFPAKKRAFFRYLRVQRPHRSNPRLLDLGGAAHDRSPGRPRATGCSASTTTPIKSSSAPTGASPKPISSAPRGSSCATTTAWSMRCAICR